MSTGETTVVSNGRSFRGVDAEVWRVVTVLILGSVMSVLDATIVNVALQSLSVDLHSSLNDVRWVVSAYLLALAAVVPTTAWLARRIGRKRLYLTSIVLFTLGSALCGFANSTGQLILFRIIQGVGGGMIVPVGQMILVRAAGPLRLARVMSAYGVPVVLAPVVGPTVGGLLLDTVGWRWIFFVNIPIGVLAVFLGMRQLHTEPREDAGRFDVLGLVFVASGLVGITYGLAGVGSPKSTTHVLVPLVGGAIMIAAFVLHARRIARPLLDLRLYLNRAFSASMVTTFCLGAALFGGIILMPLYLQTVRHEDALMTGLLIAPRGLGAAAATWWSARLTDRIGSGATAAMGCLINLCFTIPFVALDLHTSYALTSVAMFFQGVGFGFSIMPAMTAAYRTLRPEQINDATPQQNIIMRVGGALGTAILIVVLEHHLSAAGPSPSAQAAAFASTFWWVVAITAAAVVPTLALTVIERKQRRDVHAHDEPAPKVIPRLTEVE